MHANTQTHRVQTAAQLWIDFSDLSTSETGGGITNVRLLSPYGIMHPPQIRMLLHGANPSLLLSKANKPTEASLIGHADAALVLAAETPMVRPADIRRMHAEPIGFHRLQGKIAVFGCLVDYPI